MKNTRKVVSILILSTFIVGLTACADNTNSNEKQPDNENEEVSNRRPDVSKIELGLIDESNKFNEENLGEDYESIKEFLEKYNSSYVSSVFGGSTDIPADMKVYIEPKLLEELKAKNEFEKLTFAGSSTDVIGYEFNIEIKEVEKQEDYIKVIVYKNFNIHETIDEDEDMTPKNEGEDFETIENSDNEGYVFKKDSDGKLYLSNMAVGDISEVTDKVINEFKEAKNLEELDQLFTGLNNTLILGNSDSYQNKLKKAKKTVEKISDDGESVSGVSEETQQ